MSRLFSHTLMLPLHRVGHYKRLACVIVLADVTSSTKSSRLVTRASSRQSCAQGFISGASLQQHVGRIVTGGPAALKLVISRAPLP